MERDRIPEIYITVRTRRVNCQKNIEEVVSSDNIDIIRKDADLKLVAELMFKVNIQIAWLCFTFGVIEKNYIYVDRGISKTKLFLYCVNILWGWTAR